MNSLPKLLQERNKSVHEGEQLEVKSPLSCWCPPSSGLPSVVAGSGVASNRGEGMGRLGPCLECEPGDTQLLAAVHLQVSHSPGLSAEERQAVQGLVIRRPRAAVLSERLCFLCLPSGHPAFTERLPEAWRRRSGGTELCGGRKTGMSLQVQAGLPISQVIGKWAAPASQSNR